MIESLDFLGAEIKTVEDYYREIKGIRLKACDSQNIQIGEVMSRINAVITKIDKSKTDKTSIKQTNLLQNLFNQLNYLLNKHGESSRS